VPECFERGTLPFADLAGVTAAVEHLASLDPEATGTLRQRVVTSMTAVEAYEASLFKQLIDGLAAMDHVTLHGAAARRAPTAFFSVAGRAPAEVAARLAEHKVNVWAGTNYAVELCRVLGLATTDGQNAGAVRAGIVHYNDYADVERLLDGVRAIRA
jgi:selenocysteine lyase/cysteine desulfurase